MPRSIYFSKMIFNNNNCMLLIWGLKFETTLRVNIVTSSYNAYLNHRHYSCSMLRGCYLILFLRTWESWLPWSSAPWHLRVNSLIADPVHCTFTRKSNNVINFLVFHSYDNLSAAKYSLNLFMSIYYQIKKVPISNL